MHEHSSFDDHVKPKYCARLEKMLTCQNFKKIYAAIGRLKLKRLYSFYIRKAGALSFAN
jgi:hypothetical protein